MNILKIITTALHEIGGVDIPTSLINNNDDGAKQIVAIINRVARDLAKENFETLSKQHDVTVIDGQDLYDLPADFGRFNDTGYKLTYKKLGNQLKLIGSNISDFCIDYYSNAVWVAQDGVTFSQDLADDSDFTLFDEDLFLKAFKWRYLETQAHDFAMEYEEYYQALRQSLFEDSNAKILRL